MVPYNNVKILETSLEREYFTKHGMHLNSSGKECIAKRLAIVVKSFLKKKKGCLPSVCIGKMTPHSLI
jgi:lysophospholipase L1-like esterase